MAYDFIDHEPSAYSFAEGYPHAGFPFDGDTESANNEFEAEEQPYGAEPISLTNIPAAKVARALISGAIRRLALEAADNEESLVEGLHAVTLKEAKELLDRLREQFPAKTDQAELVLDDQHLDGVPELPGYMPFARIISTEAIEALDGRYGAGFTAHNLAELIEQRDRKAMAGKAAGTAAVSGAMEVQETETLTAEHDPLADNAENEFAYRWREGQLYVGDIPFRVWYSLLHAAAANFMQQLRSEGQDDLPDVNPIDPEDLRKYVAEAKAEGRPLVMRTRTGLPILTSQDRDIDVAAINRVFHEMGYDPDRNFVYDALEPALLAAPYQRGPLRSRPMAPEPELPEDRSYRLGMILQDTDSISHTRESAAIDPGDGYAYTTELDAAGRIGQSLPRRAWADPATDRATVLLRTAGRIDSSGRPHMEPDTSVLVEREEDGSEEFSSEERPRLRPSDRTLERLQQMSYYMRYETEGMRGMWEWTQMFFVQRPLLGSLFVAQKIIRK